MRIAVRIGIHTGLVVVGDVGSGSRQEPLALGETPNMAARLQGLAAPDMVAVSATTFQLIQGYFTAESLGAHTLRGVTAPVHVYHILGESGVQSRLDAVAPTRWTPLVGRGEEVALLHRRWDMTKTGLGQVVLLSGEAGIGKSRLVQVLKDHIAGEPHARLEWRASPYHQQSALYPVIDQLHRRLRWHQDEAPPDHLRALEAMLVSLGQPLVEAVPLLAALLSLPLPASYPPLTLTPHQQRQHTLAMLLAWLHAEAQRQPVLCVVEDLHWVDPSTLELLSRLMDPCAQMRLCLVLTCRPEFHPPWAMVAHLTALTLRRFAPAEVERLATHVAGEKALPRAVLQEVVDKTDGVPLFVEELTKTVLASGLLHEQADHYALPGLLPPLAIPATLQDALMARLDQLATAKAVAQLGATLGREFPYALLRAVAPVDEVELGRGLVQLVQAEVLYQRGALPQATYLFKHALLQETAYQSLLKSTRQHYHQRIAQTLAAQFPETTAMQPELLAHHYTEAGLQAQGLPYWYAAGQRAMGRSAYAEARQHLTTGLEVLATMPETLARHQHELDLLTALNVVLSVTTGPTAPAQEPVLTRAAALSQQVGEPPQRFAFLQRLFWFHHRRGECHAAQAVAEQLLDLAHHQHDATLLLGAHHMMGWLLSQVGAFAPARTHLEQGIALAAPQGHATPRTTPGGNRDDGVSCRAMVAVVLWELGYPEQAVQRCEEALTLAHALAHPYSLTNTLITSMHLHAFRREWPTVQAYSEAVLALATEHGFRRYGVFGALARGMALTMQGQGDPGMTQIQQEVAALQAMESGSTIPAALAWLAEAHGKMSQVDEALRLLAEALALVETTGEHRVEAKLHCLFGELLLQQAVPEVLAAEARFQQALTIARRQQAKAWELRTATSLSRLWQQQGKRAEAHALLAPIYGWFTEGFDTADLQDAKALLEELGG